MANETDKPAAETVGEMMESGANIVGRGISAGIEGLSQLADLAMKVKQAAPSPEAVGSATTRAINSTAAVGRSVAKGARDVARTASRAGNRVKRAVAKKARPKTKARSKAKARPKAKARARTTARTARRAKAKTRKRRARKR